MKRQGPCAGQAIILGTGHVSGNAADRLNNLEHQVTGSGNEIAKEGL